MTVRDLINCIVSYYDIDFIAFYSEESNNIRVCSYDNFFERFENNVIMDLKVKHFSLFGTILNIYL